MCSCLLYTSFDAAAVRDMFQGNAGMQMTLLKLLDRHNEEMKARVGVDRAPTTMSTYVYTRRTLAEFIKTEFKVSDLAFGQLNEQFIRAYQDCLLYTSMYVSRSSSCMSCRSLCSSSP